MLRNGFPSKGASAERRQAYATGIDIWVRPVDPACQQGKHESGVIGSEPGNGETPLDTGGDLHRSLEWAAAVKAVGQSQTPRIRHGKRSRLRGVQRSTRPRKPLRTVPYRRSSNDEASGLASVSDLIGDLHRDGHFEAIVASSLGPVERTNGSVKYFAVDAVDRIEVVAARRKRTLFLSD